MTHAVKRIVAVAIISTVAMISAAAQRALAPDNRETAVRAALTRFLTAFENLDWDAFRASFNDDVTVFFPMPEPAQRFEGRAAVEAQFQQVFASIRATRSGPPFQRLTPEDLRIQMIGTNVGVASFHLRNEERMARRTIVFTLTPLGWRIAHLHASNVAKAVGER